MANPLDFGSFETANQRGVGATAKTPGAYNTGQQGVFGANPLMTPKYARNNGPRDAEFRDTMARLYISLADAGDPAITAYLASLPNQETKALASVLLSSGKGGSAGTGFIDFFLTSANESFQEVMQVDKVLADDYVAFYYGQSPPMFQYSGVLLNSMQDDHRSGFARAYLELLRGTQLARRGALARLRYDSVIVSGTMNAHQQVLVADNELAVQFSFSFLVKEYVILPNAKFTKMRPEQYVQLAAQAEVTKLAPTGVANDQRVRTVSVTPPIPAGQSAAGTPAPTTVIDTSQNSMVQTNGAAAQFLPGLDPTANTKGTIQTPAPAPPQSFATINPANNFLTPTPTSSFLTVP
jgi:hypothetical protein